MTDFKVKGGNGRGFFPLSGKGKENEDRRREALVEKGNTWVNTTDYPSGDGFLMVDKRFVEFLKEALDRNNDEDFRCNYQFFRVEKGDGEFTLKFQNAYYMYTEPGVGNRYQDLRTFDPTEDEDGFEDDKEIPF